MNIVSAGSAATTLGITIFGVCGILHVESGLRKICSLNGQGLKGLHEVVSGVALFALSAAGVVGVSVSSN